MNDAQHRRRVCLVVQSKNNEMERTIQGLQRQVEDLECKVRVRDMKFGKVIGIGVENADEAEGRDAMGDGTYSMANT
eukprot:scaffold632340_cov24-Prasinocladus_malaysianus.AAC.1